MFIIDILLLLLIIVFILSLYSYLNNNNNQEMFTNDLGFVKDCSQKYSQQPCNEEEKQMYKLAQLMKEADRKPTPKSPLSSNTYKKFYKKRSVGVKPRCSHYNNCFPQYFLRHYKWNNYLKYAKKYAKWKLLNKAYRGKEIPVEMSFYDTLKKVDNIIGYRTIRKPVGMAYADVKITNDIDTIDLKSDRRIKNKRELKKIIPKMIKARIIFSKKKATIIFKLKPADEKNLYWVNVKNDEEYYYIDDLLKENNIPIITNQLCS